MMVPILSLFTGCIAALLIGFALGIIFGATRQIRDDADSAISSDPPKWWKKELIDAEARKQKREIK